VVLQYPVTVHLQNYSIHSVAGPIPILPGGGSENDFYYETSPILVINLE